MIPFLEFMKEMSVKKLGWLLLVTVTLTEPAQAQSPVVPTELTGVSIISASQMAALPLPIYVIDVRPQHDYFVEHIRGALHVPYRERSKRNIDFDPAHDDLPAFLHRLNKFAPLKERPIVFYCNGLTCWKSYKGAKAALEDGYRRVLWLRHGIGEWSSEKRPTESDF